ncbi:MAG: telomere resolvase, partial [Bacteroidales bacterium]|nr:telomere resolvase [Bacteroidales bacterium]
MKSLIPGLLLTLIFTCSVIFSTAQHFDGKVEKKDGKTFVNGLPVFTDSDFEAFQSIPELKLPEESKSRNLPESVDNSQLPYFRPIFDQVALECGQASGVAYTFTYEINRLRDLPANVPENQYVTHFVY